MTAIQQAYTVNDKKQVVIQLPSDFQGHEVMISWQPVIDANEQKRHDLLALVKGWDVSDWSDEMLAARSELLAYIKTEWDPNGPRVMDLLHPFVQEPDWLTGPLPQEMEDYFYGSLNDEYCISLEV